jgi:aryl-alcohol dehydrogenase-like predicted oxidoreductase
MTPQTPTLQRRDFLTTSCAAAMGTALLAVASDAVAEPRPSAGPIPTRQFGKTGRLLPILGMGSSPLVALWAPGYGAEPRSVEARAALVRRAYDRGVRYFDTARVYFDAEQVMGQGLKGVRADCFVATKVAASNPAFVRPSVEKSLRELDMDHVELLQIHSPAIENVGFAGAMKIHAELVKLRDEGLCRFIGLTTHVAFETVSKLIATGGFDQVLLAYGYFRKGMDTLLSERNLNFREMCLAKAHELKMAVVAMKVMAASVLGRMSARVVPDYDPAARAKLPAAAMRWVLNDARVSLLNIGMGYAEEIEQNAAVLAADLKLTDKDRTLLKDYSARAYQSARFKSMRVV